MHRMQRGEYLLKLTEEDFFLGFSEQSKIITRKDVMKQILAQQKLWELVEDLSKNAYDEDTRVHMKSLLFEAKGEKE